MMSRGTIAKINLDALRHNFSIIHSKLPLHPVIAMIKANAYGHGSLEVAEALPNANAFGVATLNEALALRAAGIQQDIVLMAGFQNEIELRICHDQNLTSVIHSFHQLELLETVIDHGLLKIWLKIDTGMHRLGFFPEEISEVYQRLVESSAVMIPIGLMTHLATADWLHSAMTQQQLEIFGEVVSRYEGPKSVANSAIIMGEPNLVRPREWLRPGIMLYGVSPFAGTTGREYGLRPVMSLEARIMLIKNLHCGDKIGYGGTWQCPEDMSIGVVSIGYGDGYPRSVKNGTPVLVNGVRCAVVGRVSMDMITIDLRSCPEAAAGDTVVLWGEDLPIEEIAVNADGFSYEILSGITPRVERQYVSDQAESYSDVFLIKEGTYDE